MSIFNNNGIYTDNKMSHNNSINYITINYIELYHLSHNTFYNF